MTTSVTLTPVESTPETPSINRFMIYAKTDRVLYTMGDDGVETTVWPGERAFKDAVDLEDHSTQDMPLTSIGAKLMEDEEQPSIDHRRFENGVSSGIGLKFWVPRQARTLLIKCIGRTAATAGNLSLYLNFRSFPDLNWHGQAMLIAQPAITQWNEWSVSLNLLTLQLRPDTFQQFSLVRQAQLTADTVEGYWDLAAICVEAIV